jgi:hypothetical protein
MTGYMLTSWAGASAFSGCAKAGKGNASISIIESAAQIKRFVRSGQPAELVI